MAQLKLLYRNILESGTLAVTSENASFPKYRLYDRDIGLLFKGNSTPANFYITRQPAESLLHLNGANGSTTITDEYGRAWVVIGTAQLSTTDPKFGSACLLLDGDSDYIRSTAIADLGPGHWTIEGWFKFNNLTQDQTILSFINSNLVGVALQWKNAGTKLELYISSNGTTWNVSAGVGGVKTSWATGTWYKFALVFTGSAYKVYIGTAGAAAAEDISVSSTATVCGLFIVNDFGAHLATMCFAGKMDEIRITTGTARYGSAFVPESAEFSAEAAIAVDRLIIPAGHNLNGLALTAQYSTDNFVSDTNDAASWTQSGSGLINQPFTSQSKHYWRLKIASPVLAPELHEMIFGNTIELTKNPDYGGPFGMQENIERWEAESGLSQRVKNGEMRRRYRYDFRVMEPAQKTEFESWRDACSGRLKPFYLCDVDGNWVFVERTGDLMFVIPETDDQYSAGVELLEVLP